MYIIISVLKLNKIALRLTGHATRDGFYFKCLTKKASYISLRTDIIYWPLKGVINISVIEEGVVTATSESLE